MSVGFFSSTKIGMERGIKWTLVCVCLSVCAKSVGHKQNYEEDNFGKNETIFSNMGDRGCVGNQKLKKVDILMLHAFFHRFREITVLFSTEFFCITVSNILYDSVRDVLTSYSAIKFS